MSASLGKDIWVVLRAFELYLGRLLTDRDMHDPYFRFLLNCHFKFYTHVYGHPMTLTCLKHEVSERLWWFGETRWPPHTPKSHTCLETMVSALARRKDIGSIMRDNLTAIAESLGSLQMHALARLDYASVVEWMRMPDVVSGPYTRLTSDVLPAPAPLPFVKPPGVLTQLFDIEKTRLLGDMGVYKCRHLSYEIYRELENALRATPLYQGHIVQPSEELVEARENACKLIRQCAEDSRLGRNKWPTRLPYKFY